MPDDRAPDPADRQASGGTRARYDRRLGPRLIVSPATLAAHWLAGPTQLGGLLVVTRPRLDDRLQLVRRRRTRGLLERGQAIEHGADRGIERHRYIVWRVSLEAEMLAFIRAGVDHHATTCPLQPKAILLNPGNYELFGWDELWGIPVLPDDRVAPKRFRIDCDGSAFGIEDELAEAVSTEAPAERPLVVPIGPREDEPTAAA